MTTQWHPLNLPPSTPLPAPDSTAFSITAPPKTDIWKPDEQKHVFDAPYLYHSLPSSSSFTSFSLTISANWKTLYDQGGLMIVWPSSGGKPDKWVKAGIEVFNGKPHLGVVGTDRFSDWSLAEGEGEATVEAVRVGTTLWVYLVKRDGERQALREVKWAFLEERGEGEMWVGAYAAKPTPDEGDAEAGVEVQFRDVELKVV